MEERPRTGVGELERTHVKKMEMKLDSASEGERPSILHCWKRTPQELQRFSPKRSCHDPAKRSMTSTPRSRSGICINCPTDVDLLGPCTVSLFANAYRWFCAVALESTLSHILEGLPIWLTVETPCAHPTGQMHTGGLSLRSPRESSTLASNI